jgi:flagellar hook-basal body complex protein FliE
MAKRGTAMAMGAVGPASLAPPDGGFRATAPASSAKAPFTDTIEQFLKNANANQAEADRAVRDLAQGNADNLHNVMLATVKADLSFRMVLEIRNRLTDAYQEIMRMTV